MLKANARKRHLTVAGIACLAAVATAPLAVTTFGPAELGLPGLASASQQLMAMLDARSPGERAAGALTQSKIKKRLAHVPRERALGKVFPPKPTPAEQLAKVIVPEPPVAVVPPIVPIAPPSVGEIISPATFLASVPPTGGGTIIGGGGAGSPPPTSITPPTTNVPPPPVTTAVPEPGTWLLMLLGFGMIGSATPRRRQRARQVAA